ncbi:hypothetical protein ACOMHN_015738 [Nucella lapillus]
MLRHLTVVNCLSLSMGTDVDRITLSVSAAQEDWWHGGTPISILHLCGHNAPSQQVLLPFHPRPVRPGSGGRKQHDPQTCWRLSLLLLPQPQRQTCRGEGGTSTTNNSLSPTCSSHPVHRSSSDLPSHHSAAGSDVSSETSRASAGASLERFFTQMGMGRDVTDPPLIQQRPDADASSSSREAVVFESISSLDSYDARSLCSAISRSEKEISDSEAFERNQQQTTVVERNARILKWLNNVKKAKTPAPAGSSVPTSASTR